MDPQTVEDEEALNFDECESKLWSQALFRDGVSALGLDLSNRLAAAPGPHERSEIRKRFVALVDRFDESTRSFGFIAQLVFRHSAFAQEYDAQVASSQGPERARFGQLSVFYEQAVETRREREGHKCWAAQHNTVKIWGHDFVQAALQLDFFDQPRHFWSQARSAAGRVKDWQVAREMLNFSVFNGSAVKGDWGALNESGPKKLFRPVHFQTITAGASVLDQVMIDRYDLVLDRNGMIDFSDRERINAAMRKRTNEFQSPPLEDGSIQAQEAEAQRNASDRHEAQQNAIRQSDDRQDDVQRLEAHRAQQPDPTLTAQNAIPDDELQQHAVRRHEMQQGMTQHLEIRRDGNAHSICDTSTHGTNTIPDLESPEQIEVRTTALRSQANPKPARLRLKIPKRKIVSAPTTRPSPRKKQKRRRPERIEDGCDDADHAEDCNDADNANDCDDDDHAAMFAEEPLVDDEPRYLLHRAYLAMKKALVDVNIDPGSEVETPDYPSHRDRLYHYALQLLHEETRPRPAKPWQPRCSGKDWLLKTHDELRAGADVWVLNDEEACSLMDSKNIKLHTVCLIRGRAYAGNSDWFRKKIEHLPKTYKISIQDVQGSGPITIERSIKSTLKGVYETRFNYAHASDYQPINCLDIHLSGQNMDPLFTRHPRFDLIDTIRERLYPRPLPNVGKPTQAPSQPLQRPVDIESSTKFCALSSYLTFSQFHKDAYNCTWVRCEVGIKVWFYYVGTNSGSYPKTPQDPDWNALRYVILRPGDVLYMPAGVAVWHAVLTIQGPCVITGGQRLDQECIAEQLQEMHAIMLDPLSTNEEVPALQLPEVLDEIILLAKENPNDFSVSTTELQALKEKISCEVACKCPPGGSSSCTCRISQRQCTAWCECNMVNHDKICECSDSLFSDRDAFQNSETRMFTVP